MKKGIEMKNWEDLSLFQKLIIGVAIIAVAVIAPEIAMLLQFGGIEVAFAFQASFCFLALAFTGSSFFAVSFFMPGLLLNGALV